MSAGCKKQALIFLFVLFIIYLHLQALASFTTTGLPVLLQPIEQHVGLEVGFGRPYAYLEAIQRVATTHGIPHAALLYEDAGVERESRRHIII